MKDQKYQYLDWTSIHNLCAKIYQKIRSDQFIPDVVVGIARGGWVPARILADFFITPNTANVKVEFYNGIFETKDQPYFVQPVSGETRWKRVLLVDDISDTGNSLKATIEHLQHQKVADLRTLCLHIKPWTKQLPDYYAESTDAWIIYPWEIKEFVFNFTAKIVNEKKSFKEIEAILLKIGLPPPQTKSFLEEWFQQRTTEQSV